MLLRVATRAFRRPGGVRTAVARAAAWNLAHSSWWESSSPPVDARTLVSYSGASRAQASGLPKGVGTGCGLNARELVRWSSSDASDATLKQREFMRRCVRAVASGQPAVLAASEDVTATTAQGVDGLAELEILWDELVEQASRLAKVKTQASASARDESAKDAAASWLLEMAAVSGPPNALASIDDVMKAAHEEGMPKGEADGERVRAMVSTLHESGALMAARNGVVRVLREGRVAEVAAAATERGKKLQEDRDARRKEFQGIEDQRLRPSKALLRHFDAAIRSPHIDVLSKIAARVDSEFCKPESLKHDFKAALMNFAIKPHGLAAAAAAAGFSFTNLPVLGSAQHPLRWIDWPRAHERRRAMRFVAGTASDLASGGHISEVNGGVLLGPRGTGKSAILQVGALAAGVLSRTAGAQAAELFPVTPVILDVRQAKTFIAAASDVSKDGFGVAGPLRTVSMELLIDRSLQLSGVRPKIEDSEPAEWLTWSHYPWLVSAPMVNVFCEDAQQRLMVVVDEVDEWYKVNNGLSSSLHATSTGSSFHAVLITGSAAWMQRLLFEPFHAKEELASADFKQPEGYEFVTLNSSKMLELETLRVMTSLDEVVEAVDAIGNVDEDISRLAKSYQESRDDDVGAALCELLLQHGSSMRELVPRANHQDASERPASIMKAVKDIGDVDSTAWTISQRMVQAVCEAYERPRLTREELPGMMLKEASSGMREVKVSKQQLLEACHVTGKNVGEKEAEVTRALNAMANAGLLVTNPSTTVWKPASWTAVAAMLGRTTDVSALSMEQRIGLMLPVAVSEPSERALAYAASGLQPEDVQCLDDKDAEELRPMFEALRKLRDRDWSELPTLHRRGSDEKPVVIQPGMLYRPSPDSGVDAELFILVGDTVWAIEFQFKAGGLFQGQTGITRKLAQVADIVRGFGRQRGVGGSGKRQLPAVSVSEILKAFPGARKVKRARLVVTNKEAADDLAKDDKVKAAVKETSKALHDLEEHVEGVQVESHWALASGPCVRKAMHRMVQAWAESMGQPWWEGFVVPTEA